MIRKLLLLVFAISAAISAIRADDFKIIGYLPTYRFSAMGNIPFEQLTHVNIAFANPDSAGNLTTEGVSITPAIKLAKKFGTKVFISLGGGYLRPEWEAAWEYVTATDRRTSFIHRIMEYVRTNQLDGVDMDLEWNYVKPWYTPFVLELGDSLHASGLELTAALPGTTRYEEITDDVVDMFDWINIMAYDLTGPWEPSNPGQHSPYVWSRQCIDYWTNSTGSHKLTLGVPFYGYNFGVSPVASFSFAQLVAAHPASVNDDQYEQMYYNGITTMRMKTQAAYDKGILGIMIWELGQDDYVNGSSLLNIIAETVRTSSVDIATQYSSSSGIAVYDNILLPGSDDEDSYTILDITGRVVQTGELIQGEGISIRSLVQGTYVVTFGSTVRSSAITFVKI